MTEPYAGRPRSIVALLQNRLDCGDAPLLIDPTLESTTCYGAFARLVEGAAATLRSRTDPGDRVAVLARNGLEAAVGIWACARAGRIHVGIPVDAPAARIDDLLALTDTRLLLAQPELLPTRPMTVPIEDARLLLADEREWDSAAPLPDEHETYALIATSGTTGGPKAVRVTGAMTGHAAVFYATELALTPADRTAIHLPFAWVSGHVTQLAPAMFSGGSAVTMAHFSAPALCSVAQQHAVTWLDVVPSIWEVLLRTDDFALPALERVRLAVFGGAPAPPGTLDRVRQRLPQLELIDVYALSETCAPVTWLPDADAGEKSGSVGKAAPYAQLRLADETGGVGELQVRSPASTPGYWGDAPSPLTTDGWLRTGDLARIDDDGFVFVVGRAVDLIIRGGVNIYPAEVERALLSTGQLADTVAVGVPSKLNGQNVGALVVPLPGTEPNTKVLQDAVRDRLGPHAIPRPLRVVDELPRNRNGKPDRAAALTLLTHTPTALNPPST